MSEKQLARIGIFYLEESILEVLTRGNADQADIEKAVGIHDQWTDCHRIVNSLLNKLEDDKRVKPTRITKGGRRKGWSLTVAERKRRISPSRSGLSDPKGTINAGGLTIVQVRDLVPEEKREHYESKYTKERCNEFYRRVEEILNLVEKEDWQLQREFLIEGCNFLLRDEDRYKKRQVVFGISIAFNPSRFRAKITEAEAEELSRQHGCQVVWYSRHGKNAFYTIPERLRELHPVLEFAYNKHRHG